MTTTKHSNKLTEYDKKAILVEYMFNKSNASIASICKQYSITKQTIYNIVNKYNEDEKNQIVSECIKEQRKDFTKKANVIINKMLDKLNTMLDNNENINVSQLTTSMGILYDKTRLEDNLSTSNNSISINIKIDK